MPTKEEEPRRRRKDYDRDHESTKARDSKDKDRHRSTKKLHRRRASPSRDGSPDRDTPRPSRSSISDLPSRTKKSTMVVPEMERRSSIGEAKTISSYPSFSKAHSREAVGKEDVAKPKVTILTPDPTDLGRDGHSKSYRRPHSPPASAGPSHAPPSPPLTEDEPDLRRAGSGSSMRRAAERAKAESASGRRSMESGLRPGSHFKSSDSGSSGRRSPLAEGTSEISGMTGSSKPSTAMHESPPTTADFSSSKQRSGGRSFSAGSHPGSNLTASTTDSQRTSIAPERQGSVRPPPLPVPTDYSPPSRPDSSPRTPTPQDSHFPPHVKSTPVIDVGGDNYPAGSFGMAPMGMPPPPPPPPPPMLVPQNAPRVDYLLQNGGLPYLVPKSIVPTTSQAQVPVYQQYTSPRLPHGAWNNELAQVFAPISKRLEDFTKVISKSGSIAVATGYRSVARRLLDRLEAVFARNISSEHCHCVVCRRTPQPQLSEEEDTGVSWGEILEFVSGRRDLPQWPPFTISADTPGLGNREFLQTPMQELDPDVPDQYREHYMKVNGKTKKVVHNWLNHMLDFPSSPPQEVDDDTLVFAMLTHLSPEQRPLFAALMADEKDATSRAPTPATPDEQPKKTVLQKTALALQRLYRLPHPPRDPESSIYLLNNPHLHSMLATLAAVAPGEWDILISGRFDGFLWSGAETPFPPSASAYGSPSISRGPSRGPTATPHSRTTTPFSAGAPSRGPTPFGGSFFPSRGPTPGVGGSGPAPVQMDEETEIAVLAEVEREIYLGMEALEDHFEALHRQAEVVRQQLRERSAGLSMAAQARRGSLSDDIQVRMGTPASMGGWGAGGNGGLAAGLAGLGLGGEGYWDDGDGLDGRSEIAPDDSASNISRSRRRRPKRRDERRTPAPVEEESELEASTGDERRRR
ncbi:hypothetical protein M8818_001766 [Zalaria obscura]|uniref:Uncharacterized protein n=1 Tax=Zalaria obscura TaxID=2024903 RepID=A0ACC3SJA8_9PEZI